jgi:hypothetical protein
MACEIFAVGRDDIGIREAALGPAEDHIGEHAGGGLILKTLL